MSNTSYSNQRVAWRVYWHNESGVWNASHYETLEAAVRAKGNCPKVTARLVRIRTVPRLHDTKWAIRQMLKGRVVTVSGAIFRLDAAGFERAWSDKYAPRWHSHDINVDIFARGWQLADGDTP